MHALTTMILIAFLRTPEEGGSVAIPYPDADACVAAGEELQLAFESMTVGTSTHPTVLWTCISGPAS